jgi:tetratricopeptide (TPR) repeat protein
MKPLSIVLFIALLSTTPAHSQLNNPDACASLPHGCPHPTTSQHPQRDGSSSSGGASSSEVRDYNQAIEQYNKALKLVNKAHAAVKKEKWNDAMKFYDQALMKSPIDSNDALNRYRYNWWYNRAFYAYKSGQLESAISTFSFLVATSENYAGADPATIENARNYVLDLAMEKKRQDALKLHNCDFQPRGCEKGASEIDSIKVPSPTQSPK